MFLKYFCLISFFSGTYLFDTGFSSCPFASIQNGKARYKIVGRKQEMKITCSKPYILIGNPKVECENDEWKGPLPVCAMKNCDALPKLLHGKITYFNSKAIAKMQCNSDFTLIGSSQMHCTGNLGWNDTIIPECRANSIHQFGICHFEPNDKKQCGWVSRSGFFNWTIMSSRPEENAHMPVGSFPSHDHTLPLSNSSGHFLYLEALFAPTKAFLSRMNSKNITAKYISPLFPPLDVHEAYCLIFYLSANGTHAGNVEVSINNNIVWRNDKSLGPGWKKINIPLRNQSSQFRITIEGKAELGQFSGTAIDDLSIAVGEECQEKNEVLTDDADSHEEIDCCYDELLENDQVHYFTVHQESQFGNSRTTSTPSTDQLNFIASRSTTDSPSRSDISTINNESTSEQYISFIKVEDSNSTTETIITEHDVIFHSRVKNKTENDDTILEEHEIHANSTHERKNYNDLQIKIPTANSSSNESSIKQEDREFNVDMTILQHEFSNDTEKKISTISVASTALLVPISNNTVVESNNAINEYDYQKTNSHDKIEEKRKHSGHFVNEKYVLQKNNNQKSETKYYYVVHPDHADNSSGSKMIWVLVSIVSVAMLLFFVVIYRRYYKNKRKDNGSMQILEKDDSCSDSSRAKDDVLLLRCVLNNS